LQRPAQNSLIAAASSAHVRMIRGKRLSVLRLEALELRELLYQLF